MELRALRSFMVLAEELHFGNAAKRLHIVQPALSVQIRALEAELGGALFVRDKRHVALTAPGELLKREARRILHDVAVAEATLREALAGRTGLLDIGYSDSLEACVLAAPLKLARERYPDLQVRLWEEDRPSLLEGLRDGRLHVALLRMLDHRALPPGLITSKLPPGLIAFKLAAWPLRLAMPAGHRLQHLPAVPVDAIRDEPFIAYSHVANGPASTDLERLLGQELHAVQKANKYAVMYGMVESGLGLALLPELPGLLRNDERVALRPIKGRSLLLSYCLARRQGEVEPAVQNFINCALEAIPQSR